MNNKLFIEHINEAFSSIKAHVLRAVLTIIIVAIGIMALVGILTALDSVKGSLNESFSSLGSNAFSITNNKKISFRRQGRREAKYTNITYNEAQQFKKTFNFPGTISISAPSMGLATLKYEEIKTNPNISIIGIDDNYFLNKGYKIAKGRNFSTTELQSGNNVVVIGNETATKLFGETESIGKIISIGTAKYRVIGVLESKGSSMMSAGDRNVYITLSNLRQKYYYPSMNFGISFMTNNQLLLNQAMDEARGTFRVIRKLKLSEDDNFSVSSSEAYADELNGNLSFLTIIAGIIAFITLLGASIGLMNIMLVSVSERTREIGLRKALGANNSAIRNQFLIEAVVITELGGLVGIILGISLGNIVSYSTGSPFVIPWFWIIIALVISLFVGLISGLFPAIKAAKLSPIESLRTS